MQNNFASMYSSASSFAPKPLPFADQSTSFYDFRLLIMQNQQDMVNRHKLVLTRLREVVDDISVVDIGSGSIPKSISVRSNGYSKTGRGGGGIMKKKTHQPAASKFPGKDNFLCSNYLLTQQKVYVRGTKQEEEALSNLNCELRPVIRHPRYKTKVCRMILAADNCPYGHRCHFRHQLTDQERFMGHVIRSRPWTRQY
ncbi:hypothetical protein ACFE04_029225 [Oxalis oulophora]